MADASSPTITRPLEPAKPFKLGAWHVEPETGRLCDGGNATVSLEPRLMSLLTLLAEEPGRVLSREAIEASLWPNLVVGEDTVARAVSRLRRALGDSAQAPHYIETLPRRGYRLIAPVEALAPAPPPRATRPTWPLAVAAAVFLALIGAWLALAPDRADDPPDPLLQQVARADDLYMRFTRADNAAAIGLYERVLAQAPDNAHAQAGLANALVQRVVRWPREADAAGATTLTSAMASGLTQGPEARAVLTRAIALAERAVLLAPEDPDALKSLALAVTAQGDLDHGAHLYRQALALDGDHWPSLVNLGEITAMRGDVAGAVAHYEQAWAAMGRAYDEEPQRVGPWQVAMGVVIGEMHETLGQPAQAELWYRRALAEAPYEPEATVRLARLLAASGEAGEARALCQSLTERVGAYPGC